MNPLKVKRAILSVSDKTNIVELAKFLNEEGVELYSTGGTYQKLIDSKVPVKEINELTNFPEMMDGRIKTLNPKVHGGILALRDNEKHLKEAKKNEVSFIDLIVVNLYPFEEVTKDEDVALELAIENIDIGGPTMLRSAAKNYKFVTVLTESSDYDTFMAEYRENQGATLEFREKMALKVFKKTSRYDSLISRFLEKRVLANERNTIFLEDGKKLRYGENSHQEAFLYQDNQAKEGTLANCKILNGKEMSYNNYMDAQAAIDMILEFEEPVAVVIKHNNPCGVATGKNLRDALAKAWYSDPISAFGSVLAFNREFDLNTLKFLKGKEEKHYTFTVEDDLLVPSLKKVGGKMIEVLLAPSFSKEALEYLTTKKNSRNIRVLEFDLENSKKAKDFQIKRIDGGFLVQTNDDQLFSDLECVTAKKFDEKMLKLAEFSMKCCKIIKSNTITLGRILADGSYQLLGMGAGQPNRVDSLRKLAITKARENLEYEFRTKEIKGDFEDYFRKVMNEEVVMASDAFFPFDDTVRMAAGYGIKYIIQPGGSLKDQDSIDACDELGVAMIFSKNRHFRH